MNLQWKKMKEITYRSGYRKMVKRSFELPDGKVTDYDLISSGKVVCVLALTKNMDVVLAKQFRPAQEKVLFELPGGGVDDDETPEQAIKRELLEETGYSGDFTFVCTSLQSAYDTLVRYNFVAINCEKIQEPALDEFEFIETVEMPLVDFKKHLRSGEMTDVATGYIGLEYLKLL